MNILKTKLSASSSVAALVLSLGPTALAQPTSAAPATIDTADTALTIGPETVTIVGTQAPWITNVLTSVDILSGTIAQRQNVSQTFELFQLLPGVLTTSFGQGNNNNGAISMRGFNGEGGINAVKMIVDGVPSNVNDGFAWMMDSVMPMDVARR